MTVETPTKKVGGPVPPQVKKGEPKDKDKKDKKDKKGGRKIFDIASFTGKKDANGKLMEIPSTWNPKEFKPLSRKEFASDDVFLDFRAQDLELKIERVVKLAKDLRVRASNLRKFGDEKTRKKAAKLQRMREQMAALEKELESEGVTAEDIK